MLAQGPRSGPVANHNALQPEMRSSSAAEHVHLRPAQRAVNAGGQQSCEEYLFCGLKLYTTTRFEPSSRTFFTVLTNQQRKTTYHWASFGLFGIIFSLMYWTWKLQPLSNK